MTGHSKEGLAAGTRPDKICIGDPAQASNDDDNDENMLIITIKLIKKSKINF